MESLFKISVLLILSLTCITKTNSYTSSIATKAEEENEEVTVVVAKETCEAQEMEGFWLTQTLTMEE
jgi:hypothetical protein